jgi:hypothetical protein
VVGFKTGSMDIRERRSRGVECVIMGEMRLCRMVGINRIEGQRYEGSVRRFCASDRFGEDVGVKMSL